MTTKDYADLLQEKFNLVLTGAPGTGKTHIAKDVAAYLVSNGVCRSWKDLTPQERKQVGFVQFHPSFDYTDFVEGLRPDGKGGFNRQDGIFKAFCKKALGITEDDPETSTGTTTSHTTLVTASYPVSSASSLGTASYPVSSTSSLFASVYAGLVSDIKDKTIQYYTRPNSPDGKLSINRKGNVKCIPPNQKGKSIQPKFIEFFFNYFYEKGFNSTTNTDLTNRFLQCPDKGKTKKLDWSEYTWVVNELLRRAGQDLSNQKEQTSLFQTGESNHTTEQSKNVSLSETLTDTERSIGQNAKENLNYVFIIDEINRGELSKIFGELFYSIDPGYRGEEGRVQTQYNNMVDDVDIFKPGFYIPKNVYIIGTMNDIDRGVEAMDFAVRRRFGWIEVTAEESATNMGITGKVKDKMDALNKALDENGLTKEYHIGGAYFLKLKGTDFGSLWKYHLEGIVKEYFRGEADAEKKIENIKDAYDKA